MREPGPDLLGAQLRLFFGNAGGDQRLAQLRPCKADYVDAAIGARDLAARDGNGVDMAGNLHRAHLVIRGPKANAARLPRRSEEHTSELQSLMRNLSAVFCVKKKIEQHRKQ